MSTLPASLSSSSPPPPRSWLLKFLHEHVLRPVFLADVVGHAQQLVQLLRQVLIHVDEHDQPMRVSYTSLLRSIASKELSPALFLGRAVGFTLLPHRLHSRVVRNAHHPKIMSQHARNDVTTVRADGTALIG